MRILITGGAGSIATKLTRYLVGEGLRSGRRFEIVLVDDYDGFWNGEVSDPLLPSRSEAEATEIASGYPYLGYVPLDELRTATSSSIEHVSSTLQDGRDDALDDACRGVDAIVHLQAVNPYPEATWVQSAQSMSMSLNIVAAAERAAVARFVLASSNHVMGRRLAEGAHDGTHAGGEGRLSAGGPPITPWTQPRVGTAFSVPEFDCDATPYSAAKLAAEQAVRCAVNRSGGALTAAALRIGWCQPLANEPRSMSVTGTATVGGESATWELARAQMLEGYDNRNEVLKWFQLMWLSNRDMGQLMLRSIDFAPSRSCSAEHHFMIINGNSNNTGRRWSADHFDTIGYAPEDDVTEHDAFRLPG